VANDVEIKILKNEIPQISARMQASLAAHVHETAELIATNAKERAPVDTGNLRASIVARSGGSFTSTIGTGPQAPYSEFVHEGTRNMSPRPFLRQAAEAMRVAWNAGLVRILSGR